MKIKKTSVSEWMRIRKTPSYMEAIKQANQFGWLIGKYQDPVGDAQLNISVEDAQAIAYGDPSLIFFYYNHTSCIS